MPFEILHFRKSDKSLEEKNMVNDVKATLEYIDEVMTGALYKRELLKMALDEMDWIGDNGDMKILEGRRYRYKGFKRSVAIEGNFSAYEYILEGLFRLQIGFDKGLIETGILLLTAKRSVKSPYGSSADMVKEEIDILYPTISMPVSIALFDLGDPILPDENERGGDGDGVPVSKNE